MKPALGILVLIVGFILVPPAAAGDLIISRALLEDVSGTLRIADVAGRVGTPVGPHLTVANTGSVHWLRLRVRAPGNGGKVVLFIRPTYLNEVRLYESGSGDPQGWKTRVTGNRYPYGDRDRASVSLGFVVDVTAPEATYYLRFKSRSLSPLTVEALEPDEAAHKDHQRDLVMVFFVTSMLAVLFWAILNYFLERQKVVGLFAVHQAVYTLFGIAATGYLAPFTSVRFPQLLDTAEALLYIGIDFTTLLFCRELFKPYAPPPALMRGLKVFLWAIPVWVAALALGYSTFSMNANAVLIKVSLLYFVVTAFALRVEGTPSRRLLRVFFVAVLMTNVIFWSAGRSSQIAAKISLSAVQTLILDGLIIGGLFAMMLHTRARQLRQEAQQTTLELHLVRQKFELEQELKNRAETQANTDYLTGVSNRRHFVELAEHELARSIRFRRPFALLMLDIDHFKTVNDTWGHSVGDEVLQRVSQLIRDTIREADIFGRTGGEEFAAVIVETLGDEALRIAQRLCSTVSDAMILSPRGERIPVTISIGLTRLDGRDIDFDSVLKEADRAMYKAKQAGRNQVVVNEGGVHNRA